jgi:predicted nucleic acid-binding protein
MPAEPGVVDTNVLVYALDADASQYWASRTLLASAERDTSSAFFVTSQILCEFYSIVTSPPRVAKPCTSAHAIAAISAMLRFLRVLPVPVGVGDELVSLLRRRAVSGPDVFDLQIIATMKLNGIRRIYTFNTEDFSCFPEIEAVRPQTGAFG